MFDNLSESTRRRRSTTTGAVMASLVFHAALLAAVVYASGLAERLDLWKSDEDLRLAEAPGAASDPPQTGAEGEFPESAPSGGAVDLTRAGGEAARLDGNAELEEPRGTTAEPAQPDSGALPRRSGELVIAEAEQGAVPRATGNAAAEVPETLRLGERYRVRFRLPPTPPREPGTSRSGVEEADLGEERMVRAAYAELTGRGFRVEARALPLQAVDSLAPSEWSWEVTPREPGRQPLSLTVDAVVETDGGFEAVRIRTASEERVVQATSLQWVSRFVAEHGWWLGIAALLLIFSWVRERRKWRATAPEEEVAFDEPAPEAEPDPRIRR